MMTDRALRVQNATIAAKLVLLEHLLNVSIVIPLNLERLILIIALVIRFIMIMEHHCVLVVIERA
jgi:hypothetical protein